MWAPLERIFPPSTLLPHIHSIMISVSLSSVAALFACCCCLFWFFFFCLGESLQIASTAPSFCSPLFFCIIFNQSRFLPKTANFMYCFFFFFTALRLGKGEEKINTEQKERMSILTLLTGSRVIFLFFSVLLTAEIPPEVLFIIHPTWFIY